MHSYDSDIQLREGDRPAQRALQAYSNGWDASGLSCYDQDGRGYSGNESSSIQKADQSACLPQQQLAPSEPELINWLAEVTHDAIIAITSAVLPRSTDQDLEVEQPVAQVIVSVRNLLYVPCALSGSLPNTVNECSQNDPNASAVAQQLQSQLKNSQCKVTATLSKLILSTRAMHCIACHPCKVRHPFHMCLQCWNNTHRC